MFASKWTAASLLAGALAASAAAQNPAEEASLDGVEIIAEQCLIDLETRKPLDVATETCTTALSRLDSYASHHAADPAFASSLPHIAYHHVVIELALALAYVDADQAATPRVCGALERAVVGAGRIDYAKAQPDLVAEYRAYAEEAIASREICS